MTPIEKYEQKFTELLKEAEQELGGCLIVEVSSSMEALPSSSSTWPPAETQYKKVYNFSLSTNKRKQGFFTL